MLRFTFSSVDTKPGILKKPEIGQFRLKKLKKKFEKPRILNKITKKPRILNNFKNTFKTALQYFFNCYPMYIIKFLTLTLTLN